MNNELTEANHYEAAISMLKDGQVCNDTTMLPVIIAGAQVHATLALVEQQRIANLLALAQYDHRGEDGMRLYTLIEYSNELRAQAAEALGVRKDKS